MTDNSRSATDVSAIHDIRLDNMDLFDRYNYEGYRTQDEVVDKHQGSKILQVLQQMDRLTYNIHHNDNTRLYE